MWSAGLMLGGRYRLDALLGTDPAVGVWAATHLPSGRRVAVRRLAAVPDLSPAEAARIVEEMRQASGLQHINVAPTYDVLLGIAEGPVVVSALLVGETLAELLAKTPMLSPQQTASLLLPVVAALGAAHARGIVHGRLSPSSVFISASEGPGRVQVLDFGLAKWVAAQRSAPASVRGAASVARRSSDYAPPEEAVPGRSLDHRADIWAIGVIAYECLSGLRPADFVPPEQAFVEASAALMPIERHVAELPRALSDAIADLVVADPEHRAQNLIELFNVLSPLAEERSPSFGWPGSERRITGFTHGLPATLRPQLAPAPVARPARRLPGWRTLALAASAVAAAELVLLVALVLRVRKNEARWAQLARAAVEAPAAESAGEGQPRSESLTLRAAPPTVVIDDFEGLSDAPTLAALAPWQAFSVNPTERALPLLRGAGARGAHGLEIRFLMDDPGASQPSVAGAATRVRGTTLDLSRHAALVFSHRLAPLRAPGLECKSPSQFVAFVVCRAGSEAASRQLERAVEVSEVWSSSALPLSELLLPGGLAPSAGERAACLSSVEAIGFRVDEVEAATGDCDGGTLSVDDVALR